MDPVIVSVTDGDEFPITVTVTNIPGTDVGIVVSAPTSTPIDVTVTEPAVNVIDVAVSESAASPIDVVVSEGTPSSVAVSVIEQIPAPIEIDVQVLSGKQGPPGETPFGVALPFFGFAVPSGFAYPVGQTLTRVGYPDLAASIAPDNTSPYWIDATNFRLPDLRNRILAGIGPATWSDTMDKVGGVTDAVVVSHTHTSGTHVHSVDPPITTSSSDSHSHSVDPPSTTSSSDSHTHTTSSLKYVSTTNFGFGLASGGQGPTANTNNASGSDAHTHTVDIASFTSGSDAHTHTTNIAAFNSAASSSTIDSTGVSGTDANLPPYLTCNFIMRIL